MARVVANKLKDIIREQSSDKRKVAHQSSSIDQPLSDDEESSSLLDVLASDSDFRLQAELRISIEQTFTHLTENQQKLCRCLSEGCTNMSELATTLGVGRATVYREIERIKDVFEK
jgi:RNA polymerase sigma-70 factor (ECF subfamily)